MYEGKKVGTIIKEQLHLYEMPIVELGVRVGLSREETQMLLDSELYITPELSSGLAELFNTPKSFWLNFNQANEKVIHFY